MKIGVVGAGLMGAEIALVFAQAGALSGKTAPRWLILPIGMR